MNSWRRAASFVLLAIGAAASAHVATAGVEGTRHDLAAAKPETPEIALPKHECTICHPVAGAPVAAQWGGADAALTEALPTSGVGGASRMCLKCHDGVIAPGPGRDADDASSSAPNNAGGFMGATLSGAHPISFAYTDALAREFNQDHTMPLALPSMLHDPEVRLDKQGQMQCTTCHNPHSDENYGKGGAPHFYAKPSMSGTCLVCHDVKPSGERGAYLLSVHGTAANVPGLCGACHEGHGLPGKVMMPNNKQYVCLRCHGDKADREAQRAAGLISAEASPPDILRQLRKLSAHPVPIEAEGMRDAPIEGRRFDASKVYCESCHDPHHVAAPDESWTQRRTWPKEMVDSRGEKTVEALICFQCHGSHNRRKSMDQDIERRMDPANASYHPVLARGRGSYVPSLMRPLTEHSMIACTDCHGSDETSGPQGPHGSIYEPILRRHFNRLESAGESPFQYALCYGCHNRSILMSSRSFNEHSRHVQVIGAKCTTCHDVHGSQQYPRLIHFDERVVFPNSVGRRTWDPTTRMNGSCSLSCHGNDHQERRY